MTPTAKLYIAPQLPEHWVAADESGSLVFFPARSDGWRARAPYRGHKRALRPIDTRNAVGTGWPGVPVGRPPRGDAAADTRVTVRMTASECAALAAQAKMERRSAGAVIREALCLYLGREVEPDIARPKRSR